MRNDSLLRVLSVLRELQGGPRTLAQLADTTHVTQRTIRRDLEALSVSGFPVLRSTQEGDRYWQPTVTWRLASTACPVCERGR